MQDTQEQGINIGKYEEGKFSRAGGSLGEIQAPTLCRSPGIKLEAGGRGEKSLKLMG